MRWDKPKLTCKTCLNIERKWNNSQKEWRGSRDITWKEAICRGIMRITTIRRILWILKSSKMPNVVT